LITQKQIEAYVAKFQKILKLQNWDIIVKVMPLDQYNETHGKDFAYETNACTEIDDINYKASIYVRDDLTKEIAFDALIHECVHLVTHPYDSFVRDVAIHCDSRKMRKEINKEALWKMETQVAKITNIIRGLI